MKSFEHECILIAARDEEKVKVLSKKKEEVEMKREVNKPPVSSLLAAISTVETYRNRELSLPDEKSDEIDTLFTDNALALSEMKYVDYDRNAFKELIDSIEHNGLRNFNMNSFISKIDSNTEGHFNMISEIHRSYLINHLEPNEELFSTTTNKFNCDTVGCIAGFAMALAMKWETPNWMQGDSRDYSHHFEAVACNYLNIPIWVGRKIFYGDEGCVWAFAKAHSAQLGGGYENIDLLGGFDENDFDKESWDCFEIDLSSVSYKDAVNILNDIIDGKILFSVDEDNGICINPAYKAPQIESVGSL